MTEYAAIQESLAAWRWARPNKKLFLTRLGTKSRPRTRTTNRSGQI